MTSPRVAVCLAAFNGARWLPEQLKSILEQRRVDVRVFISVDQSSDGTEEMVDSYAMRDQRVVVLPHGHRFGIAARNFFRIIRDVDFSGFDYVSLADQDDIWTPDKLFRAHEVLIRTKGDAYSSNVIAFWPSGRQMLIRKSQAQRRWDFLFEAAGPGCTYVLRTPLMEAVKSLLVGNWTAVQMLELHDWFLYAFARANNYRWVIDERPGILYRQHAANQVGTNTGWRAIVFRARKVLSTCGPSQATLVAGLVGLETHPFVARGLGGGRPGLLWLAAHAGQCRRRMRDRVIFAMACAGLCVMGPGRR